MNSVPNDKTLWEIREYIRRSELQGPEDYMSFMAMRAWLDDPNTKRIWFDSRQATVFAESGQLVFPASVIRCPFYQFYLEFTEPVEIGEQEPGYKDLAVGLLFSIDSAVFQNKNSIVGREISDEYLKIKEEIKSISSRHRALKDFTIGRAAMFFKAAQNPSGLYCDRSWSFILETGETMARIRNVLETNDPSEVPEDWRKSDGFFMAGEEIAGLPNRKIGWWERVIQQYTNLLLWSFAYMMAKSVKIVEVPFTRQVRRALEREGKVPQPWHVVRVEPKIYREKPETVGGSSSEHGYRYDVIGTLRFNKHKLKDGTYRDTIEWVPPHQRGLKHSVYIPKTYRVDRNRKILPEMNQYFGRKGATALRK
jgi:hypothetical protein